MAVPKLVTPSVTIGTRFPAPATSLGKVLLAALSPEELDRVLAEPSRSNVDACWKPDREELETVLRDVRAKGWALTDEQLAPGIRSVTTPIRDGDGTVMAAVNVNAHAAQTPVSALEDSHLPVLLKAASSISADWEAWQARPIETIPARDGGASPA